MHASEPIYPGEHLVEMLEELGISQYRLAKAIGVPPARVIDIVHCRRSITADMALRIGHALGMSPEYWLKPTVHVRLGCRPRLNRCQRGLTTRLGTYVIRAGTLCRNRGGLTTGCASTRLARNRYRTKGLSTFWGVLSCNEIRASMNYCDSSRIAACNQMVPSTNAG